MKMDEYNNVKDMTYLEYCDYLQNKYGIGRDDYFSPKWNKKPKVSRTKDGLFAHHKMEDHMILLSTPAIAKTAPYEWQKKENIVYCDYLEHLLLHVLIRKYPAKDALVESVGIGGILAFIVPELNDIYSGWIPKQAWQRTCRDAVINDEDVYLAILRQFIVGELTRGSDFDIERDLFSSRNEQYGTWHRKRNEKLFDKISMIL